MRAITNFFTSLLLAAAITLLLPTVLQAQDCPACIDNECSLAEEGRGGCIQPEGGDCSEFGGDCEPELAHETLEDGPVLLALDEDISPGTHAADVQKGPVQVEYGCHEQIVAYHAYEESVGSRGKSTPGASDH